MTLCNGCGINLGKAGFRFMCEECEPYLPEPLREAYDDIVERYRKERKLYGAVQRDTFAEWSVAWGNARAAIKFLAPPRRADLFDRRDKRHAPREPR